MAWSLPPIPAELAQALLAKQGQGAPPPTGGVPMAPMAAPPPSTDPTRAAFERMAQPGADPRRGGFASSRSQLNSGAMPRVPGDTMNVNGGVMPQPQPTMASTGPNQIADTMRPAFGIPRAQTPPPATPTPSDDPAITGQMPKLPTAPDMSHAPILSLADKMTANLQAQQGLTPPDPAQLKPHWYDRLAGGLVGGAASFSGDPKAAIQTGSNVTNSRMINAAREYQSKLQPLEGQFEQMTKAGPVMESATKVPSQDLKNQLDIAGESREQAAQRETGRHNTETEATANQNAGTEQSRQEAEQEHNTATEAAEQQRLKQEAAANENTAKYRTGELGIESQRNDLEKQRLAATIGPIADKHALDAEEKEDAAAIDKAQMEEANQIREDYKGLTGRIVHGFSSPDEALAKSQAKFDAQRAAHQQIFATKRQTMGTGKPAAGAPASGQGSTAPAKVATQQHVADYAKAKGVTLDQATKEFTQSGYKIQ
jgi:hypothetical protein